VRCCCSHITVSAQVPIAGLRGLPAAMLTKNLRLCSFDEKQRVQTPSVAKLSTKQQLILRHCTPALHLALQDGGAHVLVRPQLHKSWPSLAQHLGREGGGGGGGAGCWLVVAEESGLKTGNPNSP
jgi:hypothetical protein